MVDQVSASDRAETARPPRSTNASRDPQPAAARPILIVPSPAGEVFNQALAYELALEDHLVFACGRYEGIDERVLEWAAEHFRVRPISLGDYVLNGGEVAVLAMVEADRPAAARRRRQSRIPRGGIPLGRAARIPRLHQALQLAGPRTSRTCCSSGNHGKIAQYRRDEQLRRTAERRPDLILALDPETLDKADRATLSALGYAISPTQIQPATGKSGAAVEATPHTP